MTLGLLPLKVGRNRAGATAWTCGISSSRWAILIGIGALPKPNNIDDPGGWTSTSAPTPSTRLAASWRSPCVMPTTSITIATSMATARMLIIVRTGLCRTLATIILLTTRRLLFRPFLGVTLFAQLDQLRVRRLSQLELLRRYRLIELRVVQNRYGQADLLDRPVELDVRRVVDPLEIS